MDACLSHTHTNTHILSHALACALSLPFALAARLFADVRHDGRYGVDGSGDKIPGNATLLFEVELLRWNEREVTPDGGVFLKPLEKKGTGWRHPGMRHCAKRALHTSL